MAESSAALTSAEAKFKCFKRQTGLENSYAVKEVGTANTTGKKYKATYRAIRISVTHKYIVVRLKTTFHYN